VDYIASAGRVRGAQIRQRVDLFSGLAGGAGHGSSLPQRPQHQPVTTGAPQSLQGLIGGAKSKALCAASFHQRGVNGSIRRTLFLAGPGGSCGVAAT
jgi:hypothetical protein